MPSDYEKPPKENWPDNHRLLMIGKLLPALMNPKISGGIEREVINVISDLCGKSDDYLTSKDKAIHTLLSMVYNQMKK